MYVTRVSVAPLRLSHDQALTSMCLLDKPFALFGHSMGGLIMFELARKLEQDTGITPLCLVVSACRPPNVSLGARVGELFAGLYKSQQNHMRLSNGDRRVSGRAFDSLCSRAFNAPIIRIWGTRVWMSRRARC